MLSTFMVLSGSTSGVNFASTPAVPVPGGANNFWIFAGHLFLLLSGLWTLILGVLIMALALGVVFGVRGSRVLAAVLLAAAFAVSIINLTAVAGIGLGVGSGLIVLLVFSFIGLPGAVGTLSPMLLREREPAVAEGGRGLRAAQARNGYGLARAIWRNSRAPAVRRFFLGQEISCWERLVGLTGFEPVTSPLSGVRSNLLSYRPIHSRNYRGIAGVLQTKCPVGMIAVPGPGVVHLLLVVFHISTISC